MFSAEATRALLLSLGAGLSTLLGALIVYSANRKNEKLLSVSLGFAAGVMLSVSFTDLLPNAVNLLGEDSGARLGTVWSVLFLAVGLFLAASLDRFVPHQEYDEAQGEKPHQDLFRVGFVSMLAIGLHNFPEGIATFMAAYEDAGLGTSIALAIAMHNIPEGITVALPVYFATGSRLKAFYYTLLSGFSEPLGALFAFLVLQPLITPFLLGAIFAALTGIMLYIAIEELIPSSRQYGYDRPALIATFTGICLMPLTHVI